jgi:hypothetical protein
MESAVHPDVAKFVGFEVTEPDATIPVSHHEITTATLEPLGWVPVTEQLPVEDLLASENVRQGGTAPHVSPRRSPPADASEHSVDCRRV